MDRLMLMLITMTNNHRTRTKSNHKRIPKIKIMKTIRNSD